MNDWFPRFAAFVARFVGSVWMFFIGVGLILVSGWYFGFSTFWRDILTFLLSIVTFLMIVFLQNTQNVGDKATHLKLDELVRAIEGARNEVVASERKAESEIDELKQAATTTK